MLHTSTFYFFFFFNDTATTEIYTLSLHDALPISTSSPRSSRRAGARPSAAPGLGPRRDQPVDRQDAGAADHDRQGHRDQRQVELVAVALGRYQRPVQEEPVPRVHPLDRHEHDGDERER